MSVNNTIGTLVHGGFLHADDIRTLAPILFHHLEHRLLLSKGSLLVDNFLKFNTSKCGEIVIKKTFTRMDGEDLGVVDSSLSAHSGAVCLRCQWRLEIFPHHPQCRIIFREPEKPTLCLAVFMPFKAC